MKHKAKPKGVVQNYLAVIPALLVLILFYVWLASTTSGSHTGTTTYYYAYLSEGFIHGNLYLPIQPDPALLAIDNPYDLSARIRLEESGSVTPVDFSLYGGHFYLYWGPVPALILTVFKLFSQQPIGDFFLAFVFGVGLLLAQSSLLLALWNYNFHTLPTWFLYFVIFLVGLIWPSGLLRHDSDHARIYEAAIIGGQFFLISGLWMAFTALTKPSISYGRLLLSGVLWALAIGSRHLLLAPICFMTLPTALWILRSNIGSAAKFGRLLSLGLPLTLGGIALGWYNWARFGSVTETGFMYALAGVDLQKHSTELFSLSPIIQNLYNYLLNPPGFVSTFPFLSMIKGAKNLILPFSTGPDFYYAQPITGLFYVFPFAVFAVVPLILVVSNRIKEVQVRGLIERSRYGLLVWLIFSLSSSLLIVFLLLMFFFWAGMRYSGDFVPLLTTLSALGFWQGYLSQSHKPVTKKIYVIVGIALASVSIVTSVLLAISTVYG